MKNQLLNRFVKPAIPICLGIFCVFSIVNLQFTQKKQVLDKTLTKDVYVKQEQSEALKLSLLKKMPAFGFDNLIADLTMLGSLQYFGDSDARDATGYGISADYLEVIAENDPLFSRAYMVISPASSMFAGTPERTIEIMNKGLSKMSPDTTDAYYVWLYKGVDEILFMGNLKAARKSYLNASEWAKIAENDAIAKSTSKTAKYLAGKPDVRQAQVGTWFMVWNNTKDERIRQLAEAKIESVGGTFNIDSNGRVTATPPKIDES